MQTIKLAKAWDYVTPLKTIAYPAGEHEVSNEIAEKAREEGAIGADDGDSNKSPATGKKGAADGGKG